MTTSTTTKAKKTDPTTATSAAVDHAAEALREASEGREAAQRRLADLLDQIDSGNSASGLAELREQVEVAERVEAAIERALTKAKDEHAAAVAEETARHVAETLGRDGSPTLVTDAQDTALAALFKALAIIPEAIDKRDTTCDQAGERLHAVGLPTGTKIGRIAYRPVTSFAGSRPIPGQWNIRLDGVPYSKRDGHGYSRRESLRLTEEALTAALRRLGMKLSGHVEDGR